MSPISGDQSPDQENRKPPKRYWNATEPFCDLKASHWVEIGLTLALVGVGIAQFTVYKRQASIMDEQARIAVRQVKLMEADQRPWISLNMEAEGPLTRGANGRSFIVKYTLNNVGKSPAFSVDFVAVMIPLADLQPYLPPQQGFSFPEPTKAIDAAVENACGEQAMMRGFGDIMFPAVPQTKRWRVHGGPIGPGFIPGFAIIGCATYKFVDDPTPHRTVRIFDLENRAYGQMIDLGQEIIPIDGLAFFPHPENGSRAN